MLSFEKLLDRVRRLSIYSLFAAMAAEDEFSPWTHKIGQNEHQQAILWPHETTVLRVYLLQINNNKWNIIKIKASNIP